MDLGISPSLVSRHVPGLEEQVGARWVNRTARFLRLTEAGTSYAEFADRIMMEINEVDARISNTQDSAEGLLSVITPKWIGLMDLGAVVGAF